MKKLLLTGLSALLLFSCAEEFSETGETSKAPEMKSVPVNDNYLLKKKFAIALHKAMVQNVQVREFIKTEALKQFDNDYDVLYNYVRDQKVGNTSFRDILLSYFSDPSELIEIETTIPALTIFVPTLPEDSFSAATWDTSNDVPMVAIRLLDNDKTPIISSNSDSYLYDNDVIPGFPVIVLKECERIVIPDFPLYGDNKTTEYTAINGFRFKFSGVFYDYISPKGPNPPLPNDNENRVVAAWNKNKDLPINQQGWDRDYIYYGIDQQNVNGQWSTTYAEYFTDFSIDGADGWNALANISDPSNVNNIYNDSSLIFETWTNDYSNPQGSFWTDGKFDFNIYINYSKEADVIAMPFDARPEDLFEIEYVVDWSIGNISNYRIVNISQKTYAVNQKLWSWDLKEDDHEYIIKLEEVDLNVEVTNKELIQSTKNTNVSLESGGGGEKFKWGAKWGATLGETTSKEKNIKYTEQSEPLGATRVMFADKVIIGEHDPIFGGIHYHYQRYDVGKALFSLIPRRKQ